MKLEYKSFALERDKALKALADGTGQLVGYASVFNGLDAYGDQIAPGAFRDTIPQFIERGTLHSEHDSRIRLGTIASAQEDAHGLLIAADFHSDAEAQRIRTQILERMERGKFVGLSIGYQAEDYEMRDAREGEVLPPFASKVRVLKRIHLYEISEVTVPADSSAEVIDVKGYGLSLDEHVSRLRDAATEMSSRLTAGMAKRACEGQPIKESRRELLAESSGTLRSLAVQMDALLDLTAAAPPERLRAPVQSPTSRWPSLARAGLLEIHQ